VENLQPGSAHHPASKTPPPRIAESGNRRRVKRALRPSQGRELGRGHAAAGPIKMGTPIAATAAEARRPQKDGLPSQCGTPVACHG